MVYGVEAEAAFFQKFRSQIKLISQIIRRMRVGTDGD